VLRLWKTAGKIDTEINRAEIQTPCTSADMRRRSSPLCWRVGKDRACIADRRAMQAAVPFGARYRIIDLCSATALVLNQQIRARIPELIKLLSTKSMMR